MNPDERGRHCGDAEAAWLRAHEYALGTLEEPEAREFERHLRDGCATCAEELRRARELTASLALVAPPVDPRPELREKLLERIARTGGSATTAEQIWRRWTAAPEDASATGRMLLRSGAGDWESVGIPGIEVRRLSLDAATQRVSMIVRMAPGTRYPPHRHAAREECYLLAGDLRHEDQVMRPGDYEVADGGSLHGWQWTETGCLLLVNSSVHDELIV